MSTRAKRSGPARPPARKPSWRRLKIFSVGHSTRTQAELFELLEAHGVKVLADIRTIPRSRHNPQFEQGALAEAARRLGVTYVHIPELGGRRYGLGKRSPNSAWRNTSFRGYADHMQTPEFAQGLEKLREAAREGPLALMCAEAVPWRCHRSLVADALFIRGCVVRHISSRKSAAPHRLTPFARGAGRRVTYPPEALSPA